MAILPRQLVCPKSTPPSRQRTTTDQFPGWARPATTDSKAPLPRGLLFSRGGRRPPLERLPVPFWKSALDLLAVFMLLPFALVATPLLAFWIKLVSPGPCVFRQIRIGRGGRPFTIYKFRTMRNGAKESVHDKHMLSLVSNNRPVTKLDGNDRRLIKGGWLIRMSGLDELPQLLNVLQGEMSVVGPRPCTRSEFDLYQGKYRGRFAVQPGLTGLWQVERARSMTFREMAELDLEYVRRHSPWFDIKILLRTPRILLRQLTHCAEEKLGETAARIDEATSGAEAATATAQLR